MTMPDAAVISNQLATISSTFSSLGSSLSSAAPTGEFSQVMQQVNDVLSSLGDPSATDGSSSGSFLSTDMLAGDQSVTGSQVVTDAEQYLGVPYKWGGTNPATGLDCSGLVQQVYANLGVSLPRTSQEQATVGTPVANISQAQPGDLVFYDPSSSGPGHVGIYIGNGQMINAPHTGTDVRIQPVGNPSEIRRVLGSGTSDSGSTSPSVESAFEALGVPQSMQNMFVSAGASYGVDPVMLAAVARQESGFNPSAVSSAGAEGLMQIMPSTASGLGVDPMNPSQAIDGAAQLLSGYLTKYQGSMPLALAAYNAGPGAVAQYGGVPPYPETQGYVASITSAIREAE